MKLDLSNPDRLPLGDMSDEWQGAIMLAEHRGEHVECVVSDCWRRICKPEWHQRVAYRVRPPIIFPLTIEGGPYLDGNGVNWFPICVRNGSIFMTLKDGDAAYSWNLETGTSISFGGKEQDNIIEKAKDGDQ